MIRITASEPDKKLEVFYEIANKAEKNLISLSEFWTIYEKQRYFINAIGIYDSLFYDVIQLNNNDQQVPYKYRIIDFGYPVFMRLFYDEAFVSLPGTILEPIDDELLPLLNKLLYACGIIGWMYWLIDNIKSGYLTVRTRGTHIWLKFNYKYHWNEYLEHENVKWYTDNIVWFQRDQYAELQSKKDKIQEELEKNAFIWNNSFMGYTTSEETEALFRSLASLDIQQSIDWDMFPQDAMFGGIRYDIIVQAIIDFVGYSMKHLNYAIVLKNIKKELYLENLVLSLLLEEDIIGLIEKNLNIPEPDARNILELLQLSPDKKDYYDYTSASFAPLIKISSTQYLRSIRGFMDQPFFFMLHSLKRKYPKDWDKNTNKREEIFRAQLYSIFTDSQYICIDHPVVIKDDLGVTITDIDAVIVDKSTKQIALFQLKWQDHTSESVYSLKSKAENYKKATEIWANQIIKWANSVTNEEMARVINVRRNYIQKENMFVFVIGRTHGNYSSDFNLSASGKVVYGQWFQFLKVTTFLSQQMQLSLSNVFKLMTDTAPQKARILENRTVFKYDRYTIHMGGGFVQ